MPESTSNIEFTQKLHEHALEHGSPGGRKMKWLGFAEAIVLAIVAVSTAWSGYQASLWDAGSSQNYALQGRANVMSQEKSTLAGQDLLYDIVTLNGWVAAKVAGRERLATFYQRRFRPEYAVAFAAWWKLDPIHNPAAPPGPSFMPQYKNANARAAATLGTEAKRLFGLAVASRQTGDDYVRVTVLLATVLLLTALSQRFELFGPRVAVVVCAFALLVLGVVRILSLPRA